MAQLDELLIIHPLFSRLRPDQVERLARAGTLETYQAGESVVTEGTLGDALYLILDGEVTVIKGGQRIATLYRDEFFGEMSLVEPAARSASVVAAQPSSLFRLPSLALQRLLDDDPVAFARVMVVIVRVLSERLRRVNHLLTSVGTLADWLAGSLV